MATNRFSVNLVFALAVAALGLTAFTFIYRNSNEPEVRTQEPGSAQLPENHPQIDSAARIEALKQMIAREPQNAEYPAALGNIYYDMGEYGKASEFYRQSLTLRPGDPNIETDLATCLHYLGQDDESLKMLDNVLGYNPNFEQAKFNKGIVLIEGKKDVKGGIAVWEDLLRSNPGFKDKAELERRIQQLKGSIR